MFHELSGTYVEHLQIILLLMLRFKLVQHELAVLKQSCQAFKVNMLVEFFALRQ